MDIDAIDLKYAKQVADYLGADHTEVIISKEDVLAALPDVVALLGTYDITTIRASIGMYLVCKYIHEHTDLRVLLTGEISDELFGYKYTDFAPSPEAFQQEAEKIGAKLVWEEKLNIHAYETPLTSDAARHYESAVAEEGLTAAFEKTFGGSDNNVFAQHGIEGLVIATSMNQVHSCAEYTKIPEIAQVARIVANLAAPQEA